MEALSVEDIPIGKN